jgi:acetyl esterase/lipase
MMRWMKRIALALLVLVLLAAAGAVGYLLWDGYPPDPRPELVTPLPEGVPAPPGGWPTEYSAFAAGLLLHDLMPYEDGPPMPGVKMIADIPFSEVDGRSLLLDLYRAEGATGKQPGIVLFYGGGWKDGRKDQLRFYAQYFAKNGYTVATAEYRLRDAGLWPKSIHDAKAAVRWMRAHADEHGIDTNRIGVMGNSAGAYLALMVGYTAGVEEFEGTGGWPDQSSAAQAVVDIYGPADFTEPERRNHPLIVAYMNGTYEQDATRYERASPIRYVDFDTPPTCVIHGTVDMLVPVHQSDWLVEELQAHSIPHLYSRIDGWPHAMDVIEEVADHTTALTLAFFDQHLKNAPAPADAVAATAATGELPANN